MKATWWRWVILVLVLVYAGVLGWRALDVWERQQQVAAAQARASTCVRILESLRPRTDLDVRYMASDNWRSRAYASTYAECSRCQYALQALSNQ